MENFIVSARKYRPAVFETVVGQKAITTTLKNAISNHHLAQAFLFCGPRGVGKTTCARILAKTINCHNLTETTEACDLCDSCKSFNESASFNVHELDAASNNSVEDIRNLVDQVRIPPQAGSYKIYIIDEVHMLSSAAFNAFLKTLEEPPSYAKFILATTEKHKIIPTILSRCQIFDFKRITVNDIADHLLYVAKKENITANEDALHIIAQKADGAMRDALSIFDQIVSSTGNSINYKNVIDNLNVLDHDYYFRLTEFLVNNDITSTLLLIEEVISNGFDGHHFIIGCGEHFRNVLVSKDKNTIQLLETSSNIRERYLEQSMICETQFLLKALDIVSRCDLNYKSSNNKRLVLELSLMQICSINLGQPTETPIPQNIIKPKERTSQQTTQVVEKKKETNIETPTIKEKIIEKTTSPVKEKSEEIKAKPRSFSKTETISIHAKQKKDGINRETEKDPNAPDLNKPNEKFTAYELEDAWKKFTTEAKTNSPSLSSILSKRKPKITGENLIEYELDNNVQSDEIFNNKARLVNYIRKELNNFRIIINTKILEKIEEKKAYTQEEKFNEMSKENPNLVDLKNQLGLELY